MDIPSCPPRFLPTSMDARTATDLAARRGREWRCFRYNLYLNIQKTHSGGLIQKYYAGALCNRLHYRSTSIARTGCMYFKYIVPTICQNCQEHFCKFLPVSSFRHWSWAIALPTPDPSHCKDMFPKCATPLQLIHTSNRVGSLLPWLL